ncbi:flavodoxin family protein [Planomonospora sp. ID91781]|uniref:2-amino-4-deoxychorismate dehydrogenase n=1 Tax=Planomonospora sphaerica TaxID=161355 RepID=A0A161MB70_9ACTN|nr:MULTISPECIES: flavodoxin family protein [Planomonospora]MBG0823449.1 flavodoxin family protein [Planomonospora sp. ID91781]GAT67143.1 2-amino-4-deoxychorismate dehydrogenase [Planomonospora sphaerica]
MSTRARIVAINGSERDGNTADVLRHAARVAAGRQAELEVVDLRNIRMTRCGPCGDCNDRPVPCAVQDDVPAVVEKMVAADGIIYAAPVHGFGTAGLMQTFIERSGVGYLRFDRPLSNKVAGVIAVARRYSAGEVWAQLTVNALLNRMILVGSGFPAQVHALHRGDAWKDEEGLTNVARMVERMIDMIHMIKEYRALTGRQEILAVTERNERVGLALDELRERV